MDDLSAKITDLLNDPEGLEKITTIASSFLNQNSSNKEPAQPPTSSTLPFDPSQISGMFSIINALNQNKEADQNTSLLLALKPHLSPNRRKKVDNAIAILKIVKIMPILKESGLLNILGE